MHLISAGALAFVLSGAPNADPRSEQALVNEVRAINARADARPTHVAQPLSGTFAEDAAPHLKQLARLLEHAYPILTEDLYPFVTGERAWTDVSPAGRKLVDDALPGLDGVLEATHARSGRLPPDLTGLIRISDPMREESALGLSMRIAAVEAVRLAPTAPQRALRYCIDGLAVGRDLSYGNAISRMYSASMGWFQQGCLQALEAARPSSDTCAELSSIATHLAPLSEMFEQEKVFIELSAYGDTLSDETRAQLPPEAQRVIDGRTFPGRSDVSFATARQWLFGSWARKDNVSAMNDLIAVADRSPVESNPVFANFDARHDSLSFALVGGESSPSSWLNFARRWREARTRVNLIASACKVLAEKPQSGWPLHPELGTDARTGRPLRFVPADDHSARLIAEAVPRPVLETPS